MDEPRSISSRDVNRALRQLVWPSLRERGFTERTERYAWRYRPDCVAVVNVQSFNSYVAAEVGSTTFSFAVNLGIHPLCSTDFSGRVEVKNGKLRPREYQCDFRRPLQKTVDQPELARPEVWFIRPDGSNLTGAVEDARSVLLTIGMEWFEEFSSLQRMLSFAEREEETDTGTWGMGAPGSPHRLRLIEDLKRGLSSSARA